MFDLGWSELLIIAVVAIVVIGPKDMPQAFRIVGQWMAKARALAREFQGHIDDLMRESQVDEMKREFQSMARPPELEGLEDELMTGQTRATSKPAELVPEHAESEATPEVSQPKTASSTP
jgi:sec-independent protein translocase protein TatB